jgi:Glucodextranase, domain B
MSDWLAAASFARLVRSRFVVLLAALWCAALSHAGSLWFSDDRSIHRVDTGTNVITRNISQSGVEALALDPKDGSLWSLTSSVIRKYDANGATLLTIDLGALANNFQRDHFGNNNHQFQDSDFLGLERLALDTNDDSLWVGGRNFALHLNATGGMVGLVISLDSIQDIALAPDDSLWVLGDSTLARYSPQGSRLGSDNLTSDMRSAEFLALDGANNVLWLAGAKKAFQVKLALPLHTNLTRSTSETVSALALDAGTGNLWIAGQSSIFGFTRAGAALATTNLQSRHLGTFAALEYDGASQSLWLGHNKGVSRFSSSGQFVVTLAATGSVAAIGTSASGGTVPIVTMVSPAAGSLLRDPLTPIRVHYDASCSGQPCNFPSSVFAAYVLTATLNGKSIGGSFVFDASTNNAVYTPTTRYPEGVNNFSAFVTDGSAHVSSTITSQFTIDTLAPNFVNVTPANGSVFTSSPNITLQGSIDDPLGHVLLQSLSGATITGANPQGQAFSYAVTLQPGTNSFRLTATDPVGNANTLAVAYVFGTLTLTVTSPANGAVIDDNKVTVTGTFSGAATATITVNGIAAVISGNTFTAANVPLHAGSNTLTVLGSTAQGAQASLTITVTATLPSITIASPANGATVNGDSTLVTGQFQGPANSGVTVNGVVAFVDASNNFYANGVHLETGANTLTATITTPSGKTASASVGVSSSGPSPLVISGDPLQGVTPLTVAFSVANRAGIALAGLQFNPGGPGFQAPNSDPNVLFAFTYPSAGTFQAVVTLVDTAGNTYTQPLVIQAQDPAQMDQMFTAIWNGMNAALAAGDKATAMTYLSADAKVKYGPVFDRLLPNMAPIVASYSQLQRLSISPGLGEYAINRTIDGINRIFLVYFVQDSSSGAWLLDSM